MIASGGLARGAFIHYGGHQNIGNGGSADYTFVVGSQDVQGQVYSTSVYGGTQYIRNGGVASKTTLDVGVQFIKSGGQAIDTVIMSRGSQYVSFGGIASNTIVSSGGSQVVYSGGSAIDYLIMSGGTQILNDGAYTSNAYITGEQIVYNAIDSNALIYYGSQILLNGGIAKNAEIMTSGLQDVYYGKASDTIISSTGRQIIHGSGSALNAVVLKRGSQIVSGGSAYGTVISSGGFQTVMSGATSKNVAASTASGFTFSPASVIKSGYASSTVISSYGSQIISAGGSAYGTVINTSGRQYVYYSGIANQTTINGGLQIVSSGSATNTQINSGGEQDLFSGYDSRTTINSGRQFVMSGASSYNAVVYENGYQYIGQPNGSYGAGKAISTVISGGNQYVYNYGSAVGVNVKNNGIQILSGGIADNTTISNGGNQLISSGGVASSTTVSYGGTQNVLYNGIASLTNLMSGGNLIVSSGGSAYGTTLNSGGNLVVSSGGTAVSVGLNSGVSYDVLSGATATGFSVNADALMTVSAGGKANFTVVNESGIQLVDSMGLANGTVLNINAIQIVASGGGRAVSTTISGGGQIVAGGGTAENTTVNAITSTISGSAYNFGVQHIYGQANSTRLNLNATQNVYSGASALNTTIVGGGQIVELGGIADNTVISGIISTVSGSSLNFGAQHVYGQANSTRLNLNATQMVYSGGNASNTTIVGGGQYIDVGGTANNTVVSGILSTISGSTYNFGVQHVYGQANSTVISPNAEQQIFMGGITSDTILRGGYQFVSSGGMANRTVLSTMSSAIGNSSYYDYAAQYIYDGAIANNTIVNSDAEQHISSGGIASGTTLNLYGSQMVYAGGLADNVVLNGGRQYLSGGTTNNTLINVDGKQFVSSGGIAQNTIISGGGQFVSSGGIANSTVINAISSRGNYYGVQRVSAGGMASNTIINEHAEQNVSSGGTAINTVINSKGIQHVSKGGSAYGITVNSGGSSYIYVNSGEVNIGNVANNGKIQLEGPYYSNVTSITQLSGDGGTFLMDFSLRYQQADKIIITSAHSGNHTIILNDWKDNGSASMAISGDGLKMVEYAGTVDDADITGTFTGSYDRGAYIYTLQKGTLAGEGNDYYLRSNGEYTGIYKSMLTVPLMNFAALKVSMASLNNHITSLRDMNNVETTNGVWYRGNYSNLTLSKFGDIDIKYQGMDAGWEWKIFRDTDDLEKGSRGFYMGITASHTGLSMQDKKKEKSGSFADGGSLIAGGLYGTYVSDNGFFWDFSGKYGQNSIEMTHQTADEDLLSYNPKRNIMIGGAELGWAFSLGQNKTGLTFIPKAGYQFMSADKAEIEVKDRRANKIGMAAFGGAKYSAMAGTLAISYIPKDKSGFYIEPFAEATYSSLSGDEEVTYAGVTEKSEIDKSMLEVYAGFDMTFSRNFSLHLAGSMMKSESIKSVGGDLGLTFKFGGKNAETF